MRCLRRVTLTPSGMFFADLEAGDRLAGMRDDGLLAGDLLEIGSSGLHLLGVVDGFADAHVEHDLVELGQLHDVLVAELLDAARP